jgi:hypothetical protein
MMKAQIDIKSVLCGVAIGVLAVCAIGAATSSNDVGRYTVSAGQTSAVILDTKTGQAWGFFPQNTSQNRMDGSFWDAK